jgi:hypothetical protein
MNLFPELHFVLDFIIRGFWNFGSSFILALLYFLLVMSTRIAFFSYYC